MNQKLTRTLLFVTLLILGANAAFADTYATLRGTVTDPTGAVIAGAQITATNTQTGVSKTTTSQANGLYELPQIQVGPYKVTITKQNFKTYKSSEFSLTVNQIFDLSAKLEVGLANETVEVIASPVQVETTSIQQSTLINSQQIVDLPLNGRNFTQLEQLAPGVMASSDRFGTFSVNGSQSQQSSYLVNGLDTNDIPLNTPQILPSPDAIQEFNLISSTINPEYGRNSGGIVNALIKNGTNSWHGGVFDFYRDTFLNTRNFFTVGPNQPVFHQNQFGGTFGGPIRKDKTFFFLSYQGTYNRTANSSLVTVFSPDQRNGIFPDLAASGGVSPVALIGEDNLSHPAGTPYSTLFPTGHIPAADLNALSLKLMNTFVPLPNSANNQFGFNPINTTKGNQGIVRIDHNLSQSDSIWGVAIIQKQPGTTTLPFTGASLPGFGETDGRDTKDFTVAYNHTFNTTTLNEMRIGYARFNFDAVEPTTPVTPSSFGFTGINTETAQGNGLPVVGVLGLFTLGFSTNGPQPRKDETYQFSDNFSKIMGKHSFKFGIDVRRFQVNNPFFNSLDGAYAFNGGGTFSSGDPGADFLLGFADSYAQGAGGIIDARAYEYYGYGQDQWKVKSNLTLTLGAGYQIDTPYTNKQFNGLAFNCFSPGQQSSIFPTAPTGLLFPGDVDLASGNNCTAAGAKTRLGHVAPRFGFAYSPNWGLLSGSGGGKFSIRGAFGIYFNRTEEEGALQNLGAPPFGVNSAGAVGTNPAGQVGFANPFLDITTNTQTPNIFPFTAFPKAGQNFDFSQLEPFFINVINPSLTTPYSMNFNLNMQREFAGNTVVSLGYVGALGRHLYRAYEANPITAQGQAACKIDPTCVALRTIQHFAFPDHSVADGSVFATVGQQITDGNSNYSAFQANVTKGMKHGLQMIASYTYSHAIDNGSGFENSGFGLRGTNTVIPALNIGDSGFDARHRAVFGYVYQIPSLHNVMSAMPDKVFGGWKISGISTFQGGFPVNISTSADTSLFADNLSFYGIAENPNQLAPVSVLNPRTSTFNSKLDYFFNPADFKNVPTCTFTAGVLNNGNVCGQYGTAGRDSLHGPGIENFDLALIKDTKLTERTNLEVGIEAFNALNHTQFGQPNSNVSSANFGRITTAAAGRIVQLRAKFNF
jgi:hypothetical protein